MNNGEWQKYQIYVLNELKMLRESSQQQNAEHAAVQRQLGEIREQIAALKSSQKWEFRVLSAVWGLIVLAVDAMLRYVRP